MITFNSKEFELDITDYQDKDRILVVGAYDICEKLMRRLAKAFIKRFSYKVGVIGEMNVVLDHIDIIHVIDERGADIYLYWCESERDLAKFTFPHDIEVVLRVNTPSIKQFKCLQFEYNEDDALGYSLEQKLLQQTDWMVLRELERKYLQDTELFKMREELRNKAGLTYENNLRM